MRLSSSSMTPTSTLQLRVCPRFSGMLVNHWMERHMAGAIVCKFRGTGQTCVCANRIYVQSSIYAEFASRLAERVAAFKVGNGLEKDTCVPHRAPQPMF